MEGIKLPNKKVKMSKPKFRFPLGNSKREGPPVVPIGGIRPWKKALIREF